MEMRSWLRSYLSYMVDERGVTRNTEQSYYSDLSDFVTYLEVNQVNGANEVRAHHLTSYLNDMRKEGRRAATITRRIVSIRSFCKFLTIHRALDYNPALQLETPKADKKPPRSIASADLDKLLELPETSTDIGLRDRAMLELLYATGLRVTELISLDTLFIRY